MNDFSPNKTSPNDDYDDTLVLTFIAYYQEIEHILLRAGYTRAARAPWSDRADWEGFARQIEAKFDPFPDPTLMGSVLVLLSDPNDASMRRRRGRVSFLSEPSLPERNTVWLVEVIQEIRNKIIFGINLMGKPACEMEQVSAALYALEKLIFLDPKVKSLLMYVPQPEDRQGETPREALQA